MGIKTMLNKLIFKCENKGCNEEIPYLNVRAHDSTCDYLIITCPNEKCGKKLPMKDFEKHIWAAPVDSVALARQDSIAAAEAATKKTKKAVSTRTTARSTKSESTKKEKSSSSGSSAPRVTVRRERH